MKETSISIDERNLLFLISFDETLDAWYYFNFTNGSTQWQHPLDSFFKERVKAARLEVLLLFHLPRINEICLGGELRQ